MSSSRILIQGIGGIGGIVSGELIKAGYDVTLLTGNPEITEVLNKEGIKLIHTEETIPLKSTAYSKVDQLPAENRYDISFLIMKANQVREASQETLPFLTDEGFFATFQNGIVEFDVMETVGENRVVPVTVGFGGSMIKPGQYHKTSSGGFHIGELVDIQSDRIHTLGAILSEVDEVEISDNMIGVLWSKLAINSTINTLGAISGQTLGELLADKQIRDMFLEIYREVVDVAHSKGIKLEPVVADPYRLYRPSDAGWFTKLVKDLIVRIVGRKYRNAKSSTLQSIERGRKSEIDVLNGYVVRQAAKENLDVPYNSTIISIMEKIDAGELKPSPANIELVFNQLDSK